MHARHMLTYHLLVPAAVFLALLIFGVPVGSAFGVALMTGCVSMMFMMMSGGHAHRRHDDPTRGRHSGV